MSSPLPALPGASIDPGSGPIEPGILDGLLDDGSILAGATVESALAAQRRLRAGPHRELLGALLVPAAAAAQLRAALGPVDLGLPVLLVTDGADRGIDPLVALRAARSVLLDEDRIELIGARLPLPPIDDAALAAQALLAALDLSAPAYVEITPDADAALDVLAADGAEQLALPLDADLIRRAVDLDLTFRTAATADPLGMLCAVRAALNGAEPAELATVLGTSTAQYLDSAVRRMSTADAAVTRAFLLAVQVDDPAATIDDLAARGLLGPVDVAGH